MRIPNEQTRTNNTEILRAGYTIEEIKAAFKEVIENTKDYKTDN